MEYQADSCLCNWMETLRGDIGDTPLNRLLIPGAHDSNTYTIPKVKALSAFARCQNSTIYSQLCSGVRFFDLRVGDFASSEFKGIIAREMKDLRQGADPSSFQSATIADSKSALSQREKLSTFSLFNNKNFKKTSERKMPKFLEKMKVIKKLETALGKPQKRGKKNIDWSMQLNEMTETFSNLTDEVESVSRA